MANQYDVELPESSLTDLREAKAKIDAAKRLVRRMKTAGMDTADKEKQLSESNTQVLKFRDAFFSGKEL